MTSDYHTLRKLLKEHLNVTVFEHAKNEMELEIKFDDYLISKARWKK